jgi:transcriptional regulator with GAF, ATPase, and Fis domain
MPRLILSRPGRDDQTFEFEDGVVTLGRAESASLQVDDPAAEPLHCQIEAVGDGRFKLVDLETRSGTEVDGIKVNAHFLESGDRIHIGSSSVLFETTGRDPDAKTRRIPILRLRRRPAAPPPRRGASAVAEGDPAAALRGALERFAVQGGNGALEEARRLFDRFHEDYTGAPFVEKVAAERESLVRLLDIAKLVTTERSPRRLLEIIMDALIEVTGAERGFLLLREAAGLAVKVARNFDRESIKRPEFKVSHSVAQEVLRSGTPVLSADAISDPQLPAAGSVADLQLRSLLCIPLRLRDAALGCVYLDNRFKTGLFDEAALPLLQGFADLAAVAIENARLFEENQAKREELQRSRDEIERLNALLKERVEKQYAELSKVKQDLDSRRPDVPLKHDFGSIIGDAPPLREVFRVLDRVIDTDEPVFVHGESGTGKELVSRAIHFNSPRARSGRFVSENCSAIPDTLLESELFGHEKGAFTGAAAAKPGLFELAHRGTLFLDEIGDMSLDMQKKLLRAVQEGEVRRVGGKDVVKVDVRLISASNKDLADLIKTGAFREDLYYRLNVVKITLPPLRERREDIPRLVDFFLERIARETGRPKRRVDPAAWWYLQNHPWPGNVRELDNELRRAVALSDDVIGPDHLKDEIRARGLVDAAPRSTESGALKDVVRAAVEEVERRVIARALEDCGWKKAETAQRLGVSRPTLDAKIELYGLRRPGVVS